MGLDITAYSKVELVEAITTAEMRARDYAHPLYEDPQCMWIGVAHSVWADRSPQEGMYRWVGERKYEFRAGSYSGYVYGDPGSRRSSGQPRRLFGKAAPLWHLGN